MGKVAHKGGEDLGEKGGMVWGGGGATDGTPRCEGHWLPRVGEWKVGGCLGGGGKWGQINGSGRRYFSPKCQQG